MKLLSPVDAVGATLGLLNRLATSKAAARLGISPGARRLLYHGVRHAVRAGSVAKTRFSRNKRGLSQSDRLIKGRAKARLFDLSLEPEQEMMREALHRFATELVRPAARAADDAAGAPMELFTECQALGLCASAIPEAAGGAGTNRSPMTHALLAEWMAQGDMALALAALSPLAFVNAVTEFGSGAQQSRHLPAFSTDSFNPAAVALMEPRARFNPMKLTTRAVRAADGFRLSGTKCFVPWGAQNSLVLVIAELEGEGPQAFIVEGNAPGVVWQPEHNMGLAGAKLATLVLDDVSVEAEAQLGAPSDSYDHRRLVDLCRIGWCALAVGTCQAVLDYVVPYCNERVAFGEPVSHRQSVAFIIADMAIELEGMRLMTYRAASRAENGDSFHREAYLARVLCAQRAMEIGSQGVQLLGGHGFVCEHPVELWYRQLRAVGIMEGGLVL